MDRTLQPPFFVARLVIENFRCFEHVDVSFLRDGKPRMRTLVIGDNGAGKTTLLRAIALALAPHDVSPALAKDLHGGLVRAGATSGQVRVHLLAGDLSTTALASVSFSADGRIDTAVIGEGWFVCGYGASRGGRFRAEASGWDPMTRLRSLFSEEAALVDAEAVLKNLKFRELATPGNGGPSFAQVDQIVRGLLRLDDAGAIEATPDGVYVKGPWGTAAYRDLGDGYRGTGGWLLDYVGAAAANGRFASDGPVGTLLLDEIDEHLHPSWQREIPTSTSKYLPRTQLIATTHSPMTLVNCQADEVLSVKLQGERAVVLHEGVPLAGRTADELLQNPALFGVEAVTDDATAELDRAYDAAVKRGAGEVELRQLRMKKRPKGPLPGEIDKVVAKAAARLKRAKKSSTKKPASRKARQRRG